LFQGISCVLPLVVILVIWLVVCLIGLIWGKKVNEVNVGELRGMHLCVLVVYLLGLIPFSKAVHVTLRLLSSKTFLLD